MIELIKKGNLHQRVKVINKQTRLENARIYKKKKQAENKGARNLHNQVDYLEKFDIRNGGINEQAWAKF